MKILIKGPAQSYAMRNIILIIITTLGFNSALLAQDPHFSQYFSSPLTLNPANTGNFEGPGRLAMNFRNQWQGIGEPFITGTASFDTDIFKSKTGKGNKFSLGVIGLYDRTTAGKLTSNYFGTSLAYHILTNNSAEKTSKLSIGFQTSLANRRLDFTKITFEDQFTSYGFDLSLPNNQNFGTSNISYVDFNTGLMYTESSENGSFYIGTSLYHITQPKESFLNDQTNRVPMRLTLHSGATIMTGELSSLILSGLVMNQAASTSIVAGLAYSKQIDSKFDDIRVMAGAWYRNKDAVIPYVGYIYNNFQMGLTYDVNTSTLSTANSRYRSFELSLIYTFLDKSEYKRYVPWY